MSRSGSPCPRHRRPCRRGPAGLTRRYGLSIVRSERKRASAIANILVVQEATHVCRRLEPRKPPSAKWAVWMVATVRAMAVVFMLSDRSGCYFRVLQLEAVRSGLGREREMSIPLLISSAASRVS